MSYLVAQALWGPIALAVVTACHVWPQPAHSPSPDSPMISMTVRCSPLASAATCAEALACAGAAIVAAR